MQNFDQIKEAEVRYVELTAKKMDQSVLNDQEEYRKVAKSQSELEELVAKFREWKRADQELRDSRLMLEESDADLRQMAELDIARLAPEVAALESELHVLLLPMDPNDEKNVVLEIRK